MDYCLVMDTAPQSKPCIKVTGMQLKGAGCLDYLFFGKWSNKPCSFKHDDKVDVSKIDRAINKIAEFVEINNLKKGP